MIPHESSAVMDHMAGLPAYRFEHGWGKSEKHNKGGKSESPTELQQLGEAKRTASRKASLKVSD